VVADVGIEDGGNISDTALSVGVVLANAPLPRLPIIDVCFSGRMVEAQESTGENWNRIFVVCDASEPASELVIDIVGEILVSGLHKKYEIFKRSN
jgi:hypothetical protein